MGVGHEAYDAELAAIAYGLLHLAGRRETGRSYTIYTNSTAAMARSTGDDPGPGQDMAIRIIGFAQRLVDQGNSISIRWALAHRGVEGNEQADQRAKEAAALPPLRAPTRHYSLAFLRRKATERATDRWRRDIEGRNTGRRAFRLLTAASRPSIRPQLRRATKRVAKRFSSC